VFDAMLATVDQSAGWEIDSVTHTAKPRARFGVQVFYEAGETPEVYGGTYTEEQAARFVGLFETYELVEEAAIIDLSGGSIRSD
jgi:hypothetical protein